MLPFSRFLPFLVFIQFSCQHKDGMPNIDASLSKLIERFPQLPKPTSQPTGFYKLVRTVTLGAKTELQLRSTPDTLDDPQSVVTVLYQNRIYSLPLFSNAYRDYWNFSFDTIFTSVKPTNTTFQKELQTCIDTLGLNDTMGTAGRLINEMLISLLQCRVVYDGDSSEMKGLRSYSNYSLPEEDSDSCQKRLEKTWNALFKEMHPENYKLVRNAFWDEKNGRIYQFDYSERRRQLLTIGVRVYRQDCILHFISL